jgi:hypothetical protein
MYRVEGRVLSVPTFGLTPSFGAAAAAEALPGSDLTTTGLSAALLLPLAAGAGRGFKLPSLPSGFCAGPGDAGVPPRPRIAPLLGACPRPAGVPRPLGVPDGVDIV